MFFELILPSVFLHLYTNLTDSQRNKAGLSLIFLQVESPLYPSAPYSAVTKQPAAKLNDNRNLFSK